MQIAGTFGGPLRIPGVLRNGPNRLRQLPADLGPHRQHRAGADADGARARRRFLADARRVRAARPARRSVNRPAVRRQRHSRRSHQPAGRGAARATTRSRTSTRPAATTFRRRSSPPSRQDSIQTRITQPGFGRNQLSGTFGYQRTTTDTTNVFGFADSTVASRASTPASTGRAASRSSSRSACATSSPASRREVTPYFANRTNVSGDAGITGNNQDPVNWGPPTLSFSSGVQALTDGQYASNRNLTNACNAEIFWSRGRHTITFGGDYRRQQFNVLSQQDARGAFTFTGASPAPISRTSCSAFRTPASIAFGNADKYLRASGCRCLRRRRLATEPGVDGEAGCALGVRGADHRVVRTSREPRRGAGVHRGAARSSPAIRSARSPASAIPIR